jgi:hypothetical protein
MKSELSNGLLTLLLVLGLLLPVIPVLAANSAVIASSPLFAGGDGTSGNPYQITNWHHLNNVRGHLSSNFTLVNNLDNT